MIKKKRSVILLGMLILVFLPLVYAGNYGSGAYNADNYNIGEVPATTSSSGDGGSGGGGGGSSIYECSLDSNCNETQYCFEHTCYEKECSDDSVCNVDVGETCWNYRCVKLFDIEIIDFESPIKLGEFFDFTYFMKGMAEINGDVEINFWIEQNGSIVTSGSDVIYMGSFEEKTKTKKLFLPSEITSGTYEFFIKLNFETYAVNAHRTIEITVNEGLATIGLSPEIKGFTNYIISALIGIGAFILFFIFYLERRKVKKAIMSEVRWIKKYRITILTSILFVVFGVLIYYLKWYELIADWSLNAILWSKTNILPYLISYGDYILGGIILIILIIVARKKRLIEKFKAWNGKRKREVKAEEAKTQVIEKREMIKNRENMKKFFEKYKILLSVILLLIILAGIIAYLFYAEILTSGQLENLGDSIANSLNKAGEWIKKAEDSFVGGLIIGYNTTADWIVGNWLYLIIGTGIIVFGLILYFARKQLRLIGRWIGKIMRKHKIGFAIGFGVVILVGIVVYLFYTEILTVDGLGNLWSSFVNWIKGIWEKIVSLF